jgi:3-isopropylmalate dehydrogenase
MTTTTSEHRSRPRTSSIAGAAQRYVIACLTGDGIGPEVMAQASRALSEVSSLHGFAVDEVHPPFGAEAMIQSGQALPPGTRRAMAVADAVLLAGSSQPGLDTVQAELHPAAVVAAAQHVSGGLVLFAALAPQGEDWAAARAFEAARARSGRIAAVGVDDDWCQRVASHTTRHDGVAVAWPSLAEAMHLLRTAPESLDVVVTQVKLLDALLEVAGVGSGQRPSAAGLLSQSAPGLFYPTHGSARDIAGHGVANPTAMLLAAALLLGEGLGRRAAAQTLEASVAEALLQPVGTPDRAASGSLASGTREFVDVVLGLLPGARRDTEFALGGSG